MIIENHHDHFVLRCVKPAAFLLSWERNVSGHLHYFSLDDDEIEHAAAKSNGVQSYKTLIREGDFNIGLCG